MRISVRAVACAASLLSQTLASPPAFEVVSVKPFNPPGEISFRTYPGGRIVAHGITLEDLIEVVLDVQSFQITGGPGWMKSDRFEIEAKPPASSVSTKSNSSRIDVSPNGEQRQMIQSLLGDRFQLKFHRETREGAVYVLAKGNKPLKLQDSKDKNEYPWAGIGPGLVGTNISMPQFAKRLAAELGRPVLDQTGLTGSFDFRYEYHSDEPHPDLASSIITSLQELGLKLESTKGPVETIVIDHAEKPSEN